MPQGTEQQKGIARYFGVPISPGVAEGHAWVVESTVRRRSVRRKVNPRYHEREEGRVRHAFQLLSFVIDHAISEVTRRAGEESARIFTALKEMLHDPGILERIIRHIWTNDLSAFAAVQRVFREFEAEIAKSSLVRIREKVHDLVEIERGLLDALMNPEALVRDDERLSEQRANRVVVGGYLAPRLVLELRGRNQRGIVAEQGGETSHGAILCRALGIPAVSGVKGICGMVTPETQVAFDGATGEVVLAPPEQKNVASLLTSRRRTNHRRLILPAHGTFHIYANINLAEHARRALTVGAEGVGLYRTELEFLAAERFLSEREQAGRYRNLVMTMMGQPVVIRMLDFSPDKMAPLRDRATADMVFDCPRADFLLANRKLFATQARAVAKVASLGQVKVLYPMIRNKEHFLLLRDRFVKATEDIAGMDNLEHGVMFELPSACWEAEGLFEVADFGSLGTNDLEQYLLGTDRESGHAEAVGCPTDGARLWGAIRRVAAAARNAGRDLTVCGEVASHPRYIQRLIGLGINRISVNIAEIRAIRKLLP
ncbi:MAG: hypothetical protein GF344_12060 [Chitinivibrionales bacterium]|nr:hypothetical protein [Chitinivibrionales bacterium]MBD3357512.1 hypothetical protein [Chitinivibrionales bacterium]